MRLERIEAQLPRVFSSVCLSYQLVANAPKDQFTGRTAVDLYRDHFDRSDYDLQFKRILFSDDTPQGWE